MQDEEENSQIFSSQNENTRWIFSENDLVSKNFDIVMKSQGFTPEVQLLCKYINKSVQKLSTDIYFCLDQLDSYPGNSLEIRLLNRFKSLSSHSGDLANKTKTTMSEVIKDLCDFITNKVNEESSSREYVLYLARICQALTSESLSSDIKKILVFDKVINETTHHGSSHWSHTPTRYRKNSTSKTPDYDESRKNLRTTSTLALNKWIKL